MAKLNKTIRRRILSGELHVCKKCGKIMKASKVWEHYARTLHIEYRPFIRFSKIKN